VENNENVIMPGVSEFYPDIPYLIRPKLLLLFFSIMNLEYTPHTGTIRVSSFFKHSPGVFTH
jgi:hypothetical protein